MIASHLPNPATEQEKIELGLAKPGDAEDMVNFHNLYYRDRKKRSAAHWLWEYHAYEPDLSLFAFARHRGKVIATVGVMPVYMEVSNHPVLTAKIENILALPSCRGTGVVGRLQGLVHERLLLNGSYFSWGMSPLPPRVAERYGFHVYQDLQIWIRPGNTWAGVVSTLKERKQIWRRMLTLVKLFTVHLSNRKNREIPNTKKPPGYEIRKALCDEHGMEELYKRLKLKYQRMAFIRYNRKYLQWRIRGHPYLKYNEYQVNEGDQMRAYAFVVLSQGTLYISDLTSEDGHATALLLNTILKDYSNKAARFRFLGNRKDYLNQDVFEKLRQFGFSMDAKTSAYWNFNIFDTTGDKDEEFFDIRNWHITGLWTEGFQY